ncbi:MAG TPA: hypothetical protein VFZ66_14260 [Herpetosiphonaceae bacterium]
MEIEFAFLADAAQVPPDGKLYVLGGSVDRIHAQQFPTTHPSMTLVIKVQLLASECNRPHQIQIDLWDERGNPVLDPAISAEFGVGPDPDDPGGPSSVLIPVNMMGLQFQRPGAYEFHIVIDGRHLKTVPLRMLQVAGGNGQAMQPPTA